MPNPTTCRNLMRSWLLKHRDSEKQERVKVEAILIPCSISHCEQKMSFQGQEFTKLFHLSFCVISLSCCCLHHVQIFQIFMQELSTLVTSTECLLWGEHAVVTGCKLAICNEQWNQLTTWLSAQPFVSFISEVCYLTKIMTEIYAKDDRSPIWVTTAALISELGAGGHSTIGLGNVQGDNPRAGLACFHGGVDAETGNQYDSSHRIYFGDFGTIDFFQVEIFQSCYLFDVFDLFGLAGYHPVAMEHVKKGSCIGMIWWSALQLDWCPRSMSLLPLIYSLPCGWYMLIHCILFSIPPKTWLKILVLNGSFVAWR